MSTADIRERRKKRIDNIKTGGDMIMYIGSASLMMPMIQKAKREQNGLMGLCAMGTGAVLSVGLGKAASKMLNGVIDKVVDFWDDVKAKPKEKKPEENGEAGENG